MKYLLALTTVSACLPLLAIAQTERDLESHVHGLASLNVAIVDSSVFVELNTPWNNLIGFEHAPQTEAQHALVDGARNTLNDPAQLLSFDGGDCSLEEVTLESALLDDDHSDEHHDDEEHHDEHDEEHAEKHDEHGDEHHDEHGGDTHAAVLATYSFDCADIDKLNNIDLLLFSIWSGFEELDVQLISDNGQVLVELDPGNTILNIK